MKYFNQPPITYLLLILLFLNLFTFLPSLKGDFIWDDKDFILDNTVLRTSSFFKNFLFLPYDIITGANNKIEGSKTQYYRPLTLLSFWIDYQIWGFNSAGFHITNILIHILNCFLLFFIIYYLFNKKNVWIPFFSSFLFSLYPMHFENIAWITGRTDTLSGFFAFLSILFFLFYIKKSSYHYTILSASFYFLSLLSKENNIFLIIIFFIILIKEKLDKKHRIISGISFLLPVIIWSSLRFNAIEPSLSLFSSQRSVFSIIPVIGFYTYKTIFPYNLTVSINSQLILDNLFFSIAGIFAFIIIIFVPIYFLFKTKNNYFLPLMILSFFIMLLPSIAIMFIPTTTVLLAWRFLYLPSAIFAGLLTYYLFKLINKKIIVFIIILLISITYFVELYPKNKLFGSDSSSFWLKIKDYKKESIIIAFNIATEQLRHNERKGLKIYRFILNKHKKSQKYKEYKNLIYENLASYYTEKRNFAKAKEYFDKARAFSEHRFEFFFSYAFYLYLTGEKNEAFQLINQIQKRFPADHRVLINIAKFYLKINKKQKALIILKKDYEIFRLPETYRLLKNILNKTKQ